MSANDAKFYYNKGIIYNEEGKYGLAVDNYKTALSMEPESFEINFNLGVAYINKKEYVCAIECFKVVLGQSPDEVAALSNIALAYAKNNDYNPAIEYYKKLLVIKPDDIPTFKDLGDVYTKNKQYDNAIECYKTFLKAHPTSFVVKESLNTALNLKKNLGEIQKDSKPTVDKHIDSDTEQATSGYTESAEEFYQLAVNFVKVQDLDAAIENLRKCLKINSNYPNAYDLLNKLFKIKEKFSNAEPAKRNIEPTLSQSSIKKEEQSSFIDYRKFNQFYVLGMAYYNVQNYSVALEKFQKCLEIKPNDTKCNNYIFDIKSKITK